ncbi:hypothetical protein PR048_007843, partial [Dryococelus australis]
MRVIEMKMKRRGKREIPEKTRRPVASSGTIPTRWSSAGMKGQGKREIPEKTRRPPASCPARFPLAKIREGPGRFASVGGEQSNRSAAVAPKSRRVYCFNQEHEQDRYIFSPSSGQYEAPERKFKGSRAFVSRRLPTTSSFHWIPYLWEIKLLITLVVAGWWGQLTFRLSLVDDRQKRQHGQRGSDAEGDGSECHDAARVLSVQKKFLQRSADVPRRSERRELRPAFLKLRNRKVPASPASPRLGAATVALVAEGGVNTRLERGMAGR